MDISRDARITVYGKPGCMQCTMTKKALEKNGIAYQDVDITEVPAALAYVEELGYAQVPVIVASDENHWSGFQPQKISALASFLGRTA